MSDTNNELYKLIDRSLKLLFRDQPAALLRLAGVSPQQAAIRFEDPNLNQPELHADHVFIIQRPPPRRPYALYAEYQLQPDADLLPTWAYKWAALRLQLRMPVLLLALYLERGQRATFPAELSYTEDGLETKLCFNAIRLWEHRERIVNGELVELAPLLVLCEEVPTAATVQREVDLIHGSGLSIEVQAELLSVAFLVALREFARETLLPIFREDLKMFKEMEIIKELVIESGALAEWGEQTGYNARLREQAKAEGIAEGKAEGIAEGKAEGEAKAARTMTLRFLTNRFGVLPEELVQRIEVADADWCQNLFDRAIHASSLGELLQE